MTAPILTLRTLNRATLARQMLLSREQISIPEALVHLIGLQAQYAPSPFISVWTRLGNFQRTDLADPIHQHTVIKTTWIRGTLHIITADDFLGLRATIQPVLTAGAEAIQKQRGASFNSAPILDAVRAYLNEQPHTFAEISAMLAERFPEEDVGAMRYTARMHLPLVQVPTPDGWSFPGNPQFTLAEPWIGRSAVQEEDLSTLALRYLAAFGPASPADMQTWCGLGLPKLKAVFEQLRPRLQIYHDEHKRELFDLPGNILPPEDQPAPPRFLPEYDNLLLSHKDRARIVEKADYPRVFLPGLRVSATILVDGFVRGGWKISKIKKAAALIIDPFSPLTHAQRAGLEEEGHALVRFVESQAETITVQFTET